MQKIERFLAEIKKFNWGNEMEIPSRAAYRKAERHLADRNLLNKAHCDGSNVWELASKKLSTLEDATQFTSTILDFLKAEGGILHSYPSVEAGVSEPNEADLERARELVCDNCTQDGYHFGCRADFETECPECHGVEPEGETEPCNFCGARGVVSCWEAERDCDCSCPDYIDNCMNCDTTDMAYDYLEDDECGYGQDTCSNHLHFSPYNFSVYKKLYQLVRAFSPLFCNSPGYLRYVNINGSEKDVRRAMIISTRHQNCSWCSKRFIDNESTFNEISYRHDYALTPNELGTIEFRYNDLSKSPQQVAFYGYLVYIADHLPFKMLREEARKINFPEKLFEAKRAKGVAFAMGEKIDRMLGDNILFYNFYHEEHQPFSEMLRKTWCFEESAFEKFGGDEWEWSDYWTGRLGDYVFPTNLIERNGDGALFSMNKKLAKLIIRENDVLNVKANSDKVIAHYQLHNRC